MHKVTVVTPRDFTERHTFDIADEQFEEWGTQLYALLRAAKHNGYELSCAKFGHNDNCDTCIFNYANGWEREIDNAINGCRLCKKYSQYIIAITKKGKNNKFVRKINLGMHLDTSCSSIDYFHLRFFLSDKLSMQGQMLENFNRVGSKQLLVQLAEMLD